MFCGSFKQTNDEKLMMNTGY